MEIAPDDTLRRSAALVEECAEIDREIARLHARKAERLAERVRLLLDEIRPGQDGFEQAERSMISEFSVGLRITAYAAAKQLANAHTLHERLPGAREALAAGALTLAHANVIVEAARDLPAGDDAVAAAYETAVVPYASAETRARTKAFAESVVAALAPATVQEQHDRAQDERSVTVTDEGRGQATLHVTGPAVLVHAAYDLVTQEGHATLRAATRDSADPGTRGDARTLDQVRCDRILLRLLAGRLDNDAEILDGIRPTVQVTVSAATLAGIDDRLAELDGHGPIDADAARGLAASAASWRRLHLDDAGMVTRTTAYQPTEAMRRHLRARDRTCRFPGCRRPARRCEIDHTYDHARGGPTAITNVACLCAAHHALKHPDIDPRWRWTARQCRDGTIVWTTPAGVEYSDAPPPRVMFMEADTIDRASPSTAAA
jgi:Domain of unknown function (DUF222)